MHSQGTKTMILMAKAQGKFHHRHTSKESVRYRVLSGTIMNLLLHRVVQIGL